MKLADFFIALGFQVQGGNVLPTVEKQLDSVARKAGKVAVGIDIITAGLGFMADMATQTAVGLHKFALSTGLSTEELQRWQHAAVVSNVSAKEMTDTITNLQAVHAKMMLQGGAAAQPWLLLGINPNEKDPFKIAEILAKSISSWDPKQLALGRTIFEQAGIGPDVFQAFRRPEFLQLVHSLNDMYILHGKDQEKLVALNRSWEDLKDRARDVSNIFMGEMAPAQTRVLELLLKLVDKMAEFVKYLQTHDQARHFFQVITTGAFAAAAAITALAGAAKLFALTVTGVSMLPIFAAWGAAALSILATINAIIDGYRLIKGFDQYRTAKIETDKFNEGNRRLYERRNNDWLRREDGGPINIPTLSDLIGHATPRGGTSVGGPTAITIQKILIDGAKDPRATGTAVVDALTRQLTFASANAPAPNL